VAANYRAACLAQSKKDFEAKLSRVVEEIDESCFWLEFVMDELLLKEQQVLPLLQEARELTAIFVAARKTSKSRRENSK
jgi:four helix bundle protein